MPQPTSLNKSFRISYDHKQFKLFKSLNINHQHLSSSFTKNRSSSLKKTVELLQPIIFSSFKQSKTPQQLIINGKTQKTQKIIQSQNESGEVDFYWKRPKKRRVENNNIFKLNHIHVMSPKNTFKNRKQKIRINMDDSLPKRNHEIEQINQHKSLATQNNGEYFIKNRHKKSQRNKKQKFQSSYNEELIKHYSESKLYKQQLNKQQEIHNQNIRLLKRILQMKPSVNTKKSIFGK